jgi:hypothetical protein
MRIKILPAIVAGIVYWFIQAGWFTAFADPWIAGLGWTPERIEAAKQSTSPVQYILALLCNIVAAAVVAQVMVWRGRISAAGGAATGLLLWAGPVLTSLVTELAFEHRAWPAVGVIVGAPLVGLVGMGAIQGAWLGRGAPRP